MRKELAREEALPLRRRLVSELGEVYAHLLSTVSNSGELGTVANWEQHNLPDLLGKPGEELAEILGEPLPDDAQPPAAYAGPTRLIVPTVRTSLRRDEMFRLKAIIPGETAPREALLHWRRLGTGRYRTVELRRVARAVYQAEVPAAVLGGMDFEYYLTVEPTRGKALKFPVTAPRLNQTVVVVGSVAGGEGG